MKDKVPRQTICPQCGYVADCATCFSDPERRPVEGSASICLECGEVSLFTAELSLRTPELPELLAWPKESWAELERTQRAVKAQIAERRRTFLCTPNPERGRSIE